MEGSLSWSSLDLLAQLISLVPPEWMGWLCSQACSATAEISGIPLQQASLCSFILVSSLLVLSPMYVGLSTAAGDLVNNLELLLCWQCVLKYRPKRPSSLENHLQTILDTDQPDYWFLRHRGTSPVGVATCHCLLVPPCDQPCSWVRCGWDEKWMKAAYDYVHAYKYQNLY